MIDFIRKKLDSHFSLFIIALGAGGFLLSNLLLRELLSEEDYGKYSILITFLSMAYLFGLLGFEQVFIRFSNVISKNVIQTQKSQLQIIFLTTFITTSLLTVAYLIFFQRDNPVNLVLLFPTTYCMVISPILFNIFRLNSEFSLAQFVSNGWKLGLALISVGFFLFRKDDLSTVYLLIFLTIIGVVILFLILIKMRIRFSFNDELNVREALSAFFLFFLSIFAFSIVMFADRFIIEGKLGTVVFGDYFYLTNFVLAPFAMLQNYIGFKQVVHFKENFSVSGFKDFNRKILYLSLGLSIILILILFTLVKINVLNFDFFKYRWIIFLLLILGIVRLHSSSILPAFEVKTNLNTLKLANLIVILITVFISLIVIYFVHSLDVIIIGFILIWLTRSLVYRKLLLRQIEKEIQ